MESSIEKQNLAVDGFFGLFTIQALQRFLVRNGETPGPIDGIWGSRTKCSMRLFLNTNGYMSRGVKQSSCASPGFMGWLISDGDFGTDSITALQLWLLEVEGGFEEKYVDGSWGAGTTKSLQRFLNSEPVDRQWSPEAIRSRYTRSRDTSRKNLVVDDIFGKLTIQSLQNYLVMCTEDPGPIDGIWGGRTKRALKAFLGKRGYYGFTSSWYTDAVGWLVNDADFDSEAVKALQRWLMEEEGSFGEAGADGVWGPFTTRSLQQFLNNWKDPPNEIPFPPHWIASPASNTQELHPCDDEVVKMFQTIFDGTWRDVKTRDREASTVPRLRVIAVQQNENPTLWRHYVRNRMKFAAAGKLEPKDSVSTKTTQFFENSLRGLLVNDVNEALLFHGTKPSAAATICRDHFSVNFAGSNAGTLYGNGIYFAEECSKSDEYAEDDNDGIYKGLFCILVSRVTLGRCYYTDELNPDRDELKRLCTEPEAGYQSVLGDREKARGTYREFVVYDNRFVYPEYVVIYRREDESGANLTHSKPATTGGYGTSFF